MEIRSYIRKKAEKTFPALTHKDFRSFWIGQSISLIGSWMQTTTQGWLVLQIAKDNPSFLLGVINALQFLPILLFSLFSGVIIDRFSKKKLLIFTQTSLMFFALVQGILVWTGTVRFWHLAIIAFMVGSINSIDMPTRQSFVIELVGKNHLMNAVALNSSIFNAARVLGPSVAGVILAYVSIQSCYFINAISFIPVIIGIISIKHDCKIKKELKQEDIFKNIKEGLFYIKKEKILVRTFILITILGVFAFNYNILIPVFAVKILEMGSKEYGFLMSALGIGSLTGALTMVAKGKKPKVKIINIASLIISVLLVLLGINKNITIMAVLLVFVGAFNVTFSTTANSTVQLNSKDEYRGRVMSVYTMLFAGVSPIGSLFTGLVSNFFGPSKAFVFSGILSAILVTLVLIMEEINKRKYV